MTGETIRDLLKPLIGKSGSLSMVVSRAGHIGFITSENQKLTGVELRPDGLLRLERETGWAVIRSEEHTSELQSHRHLVCRLLLEIGRASCRERV